MSVGAPVKAERSSEELPDAVLVRRALEEPEAFGALYLRYLDRVFRYVHTYCESEDDAADLTQHIFLRVFEALAGYNDRGIPFAAWLFRIARNAATDAYRRRGRTLPWDHRAAELLVFSGPGPEEMSLRREELNQLRLLVAQLDPPSQEVLALRFAGGLTSAEIANVVGRSPAAVKKQITRAIQRLKEHSHGPL